MLSIERDAIILEKLRQRGTVSVNELAGELGVTAMTIRRHLHKLEKTGLLEKVHGGAKLVAELPREPAFTVKKEVSGPEKFMIASAALQFVLRGYRFAGCRNDDIPACVIDQGDQGTDRRHQ